MLRNRSGLKSEKEKCAQLTITDGAAQSTDAWDSFGTERETSPVPGQYTTGENFSRDISYTCAVCHQTIYGVPFTSLAGGGLLILAACCSRKTNVARGCIESQSAATNDV